MTHLLRGKQAGVQADFSAGIAPENIALDDIARFGINSQVSAVAYDPVQSLLAIGTNDTKFGVGQIYVFGQKRVSAVLQLQRRSSIKSLYFCADKLISFDTRNDICVFSLDTKRIINSYSPPGTVFAVCCDPMIDYLFLGMQSGEVLAYDMETGRLAPFKIPSLWKEMDPRARITPVMSLALHPRDMGRLLVGYAEGAAIFSFKQNKALKYFRYEIPRGAPGGDGDPRKANAVRHPRLTHAVWHPTGTFILTGHEDGSLVFWDTTDGRLVLARTLTETRINEPGHGNVGPSMDAGEKEPLFKIVWCANQDPEDTAILVAGGASSTSPAKGLTLFDMGRTPVYQTSSWQVIGQYLESPKRQRMLPIPPGTEVVDFCMIPKTSPHFAGAHDPVAMIAVLASGEVITMSFPSGYPISPTNQIHVSATFVHPFITATNLAPVERTKWLGLVENRNSGPPLLKGGAEAQQSKKRYEYRNVVQTAHADGTVRLWDAGHGDDVENERVIQVDVDRAVGHPEGVEITTTSFAGDAGELAVGTRTGDVAVFRWDRNRFAGREPPPSKPGRPGELVDITTRADPSLVDGLLPLTLVNMNNGPVTAVKMSNIGFLAAGFEGGSIILIDMRGPAIIYNGTTAELGSSKHRSRRGHDPVAGNRPDYATAIEFSIMSLEHDAWSSILLHVGTNDGAVATYTIIPQGGRYAASLAGVSHLDGRIVRLDPLSADSGRSAVATQRAMAGLRDGVKVNGVLLATSHLGARIFKPASAKGAHKLWDSYVVLAAGVAHCEERGGAAALVALADDGIARVFSIPALREIGGIRIEGLADPTRMGESVVMPTGDVLLWTGPAETALVNVFGRGLVLTRSRDTLYNPALAVPPRPTISNVQWLSGTQHVTPADLDILIGGADRPPTRRQTSDLAGNASARGTAGTAAGANRSDEGYWEYMQRQMTERTEKLSVLGDSVNSIETASANWASEASKYVAKTKQNLVMGAVKGKFGL